MNVLALDIFLGAQRAGLLFQYGAGRTALTRFIPDDVFWSDPQSPVMSWAATDDDAQRRDIFWRSYVTTPFFNAEGGRLPTFFQNLLPEGPLRRHLEALRGCGPNDHFDMLAACGTDLPGNVYAYPAHLDAAVLAGVVTQHHDALEMSVTAEPMPDATSLSGVQPKLALVMQGGRYVARTKDAEGRHIIAKLPTAEYALLPEVEALSLQLAKLRVSMSARPGSRRSTRSWPSSRLCWVKAGNFWPCAASTDPPRATSTAKTSHKFCAFRRKTNTATRLPPTRPLPARWSTAWAGAPRQKSCFAA